MLPPWTAPQNLTTYGSFFAVVSIAAPASSSTAVELGVSIESARYIARADALRHVDVGVRFISAEPLLGSLAGLDLSGISWLIAGGESAGSPGRALVQRDARGWSVKPLALAWVGELRDMCRTAGVAFFFKQWGGRTPKAAGRELDGQTWSEYPQLMNAPAARS